jgi:CRISPR/Cas system-associated protein Cas5 (RAMP superfamily)
MSTNDWAGLAVSVTTLIGALAMGVRHLVKHYLAELKPNSGSSIKDKVNDIDTKVNNLELRIDEIYALLLKRKAR